MTAPTIAPARNLKEPTQTRWLGVGHSSDDSPERAGRAAATAALGGRTPALVIVICSDRYNLRKLLAGVRSQTGEAHLIGCSTAGEIATSGASEASVVVMALGGGFTVRTAVATGAAGDL